MFLYLYEAGDIREYRQPVSIDEYENIGKLISKKISNMPVLLSFVKNIMFLPSLRRWSAVSRAKVTSLTRKL